MKYLLHTLLAGLFLVGCQEPEVEAKSDTPTLPIEFRTYLQEGNEIRPMTRSLAGDPLSNGYRISCLISVGTYPDSGIGYTHLMWNVAMNTNGTYKSSSEKKYFWAEDGAASLRHTFIAYSENPVGATEGNVPSSLGGAATSHPQTYLDYKNPDDPAKQIDFLCTDMNRNIVVKGYAKTVNLVFQHRLARVVAQLIGTGGTTLTKCQAKITYKAGAVKKAAALVLSNNNAFVNFGSTISYHTGTYNLGAPFILPASASTAALAVDMGDFILLPNQTLPDSWASLVLTYTPDGATIAETALIDLPALTLVAGKQYNILVSVSVDSQNLTVVGVTLSDWNSKTATIDPNK